MGKARGTGTGAAKKSSPKSGRNVYKKSGSADLDCEMLARAILSISCIEDAKDLLRDLFKETEATRIECRLRIGAALMRNGMEDEPTNKEVACQLGVNKNTVGDARKMMFGNRSSGICKKILETIA